VLDMNLSDADSFDRGAKKKKNSTRGGIGVISRSASDRTQSKEKGMFVSAKNKERAKEGRHIGEEKEFDRDSELNNKREEN